MTPNDKQLALDILRRRYREQYGQVADIETRLTEYFDGLTQDPDHHNGYEILGGVKFLRMLRTYDFDHAKVRKVVWLREGNWHQDKDGRWVHDSDGLKCPGTDTAHVYRWQGFQVFVLASVFGFRSWVNTQVRAIDKPALLRSERVRADGMIEDLRRVCSYYVCYFPRKTDKTGLSAYIQALFFLLEEFNAEAYCLAMSEQQAKILFNRTKFMLKQLNQGQWRMTEKIVDWKPQYQQVRNSSITPLTAGGKAKDGAFAALVNWDEFGSSPYVNGKSDMQGLVNVMRSSMGPRREPLTFGTTTAGTVTSGPFIEMLEGLHNDLMRELQYETGEATPTLSGDRSLCLLLEPDDWEKQDEQLVLMNRDMRRKVNPMLGITCQHQFYEDSIEEMQSGKMAKGEVLSKLFNIYSTGRVTKWITGDRIRPLQVTDGRRIESCRWQDGWRVFIGMDFSHGDDLFAVTYLGVDYNHAQHHADTMRGLLFADTDAWVLEETMLNSPNRALYEQWVQQGWLHVCPGEVFDSSYCIATVANRLQLDIGDGQKDWRLDVRLFTYDPAQNREPINNLKAWLQTAGIPADAIEKMVIPCSQSAMNLNGTISALAEKILGLEPWMEFSASPLWPWCFGNTAVEIGRTDLQRIIKGGPTASAKIDPVMALLDALWGWQLSEGQIQGNQ